MASGQQTGNASIVGDGAGFIRGTVSGNGSTASAGAPRIDLAPPNVTASGNLPPVSPGARSAFYLCLHDSQTGLYDFLLQDDFVDIVPLPNTSSRIRWTPGTVLLPTTTSGSGVVLVATNLNTQPWEFVLVSSGGANAVASAVAVAATGIITITFGSTTTSATLAAYMNANSTTTVTTTWKAYVVGLGTDLVIARTAAVALVAGPSANGIGVSNGTGTIPSTTAGSGILFTAVLPGTVGTQVQFLTGSGEAIVVANNTVEVTINAGTSTNASIITKILATPAAAKLVVPQLVGSGTDVVVVGGVFLTGGAPALELVGPVDPQACLHNGLVRPVQQLQTIPVANLTYFHFKCQYTEGGVAVDQLGYGGLYLPSSTAGSGLVITSGTSAPVAASATVVSTTSTCGNIYTAVPLGALGNNIAVVHQGPSAGYFLPSTTAGSGVQFTAYGTGPLYTGVSIFETAPNSNFTAAAPGITVTGNAIQIIPGVTNSIATTNAQLVTAIQANAAASLLVTVASTGTSSDAASTLGNLAPVLLAGGNALAANAVTVSVSQNGTWSPQGGPGSTILVQFGPSTTEAQVTTAVNANAAAALLVLVTNKSTTTDLVVASPLTFLSGGTSPTDTTVQIGGPVTTTTSAAFTLPTSSTIATITVLSTAGFLNPGAVTGAFSFVDLLGVVRYLTSTGSTGTTFTTSSPSSYPAVSQVIPAGTLISAAAPTAAISGSNLLISLGSLNTNNTLTNVSAVVNQANSTATPLVLAAPLGTASSVMAAGLVQAQTRLALADLMSFLIVTKDQTQSLP